MSTPWSVVQSSAEAVNDPQVVANNYVSYIDGPHGPLPLVASPAQFDDQPPTLTQGAPGHGEQTDEILREMGKDWDEILRLKQLGAVL